jgi:iron(III) transport system substrate-binding protein
MISADEPQGRMLRRVFPLAVAGLCVVGYLLFLVTRQRPRLTVYCAHDAVYAEAVLEEFERETGIPVDIKFDSEATKSLGLVELIIRQAGNPQCDVFWNNEVFGTMELARRGLLDAYRGPGYDRIPPRFRSEAGLWAGFGGRFRVVIGNTECTTPETAERILDTTPDRFAMAKPLYGTTFTHYTVLWHQWGRDRLVSWHRDLRDRGLCEVLGNATVKDLVAAGHCDSGYTDTDDFYQAKDDGRPVAMVPVRTAAGATVCIPNSVAIVRGTRNRGDAERLVDYLLSAENELRLARSVSRQVPLGPVDAEQLPAEVRAMVPWVAEGVRLEELDQDRQACLAWLRTLYAGGDEG